MAEMWDSPRLMRKAAFVDLVQSETSTGYKSSDSAGFLISTRGRAREREIVPNFLHYESNFLLSHEPVRSLLSFLLAWILNKITIFLAVITK